MNKEENNSKKKLQITFRVFQAVFLGIMALGVSSMLGNVGTYLKSPISEFSIITTVFGIIGSIMSGVFANKSKDW